MAATARVKLQFEITGLGQGGEFAANFTTTTTPTAYAQFYRTLAAADTAEALDLGDVSTVDLIIFKAIDNDIEIDADFDTSFDADLVVLEGEVAMFKPSGTVYVKNQDSAETPSYNYWIIGTT